MLPAFRTVLPWVLLTAFHSSEAAPVPEIFHCHAAAHESFLDQANRFILTGLRYQPVEATQAGYHGEPGASLDTELDDSSPATIGAERALYISGEVCFGGASVTTPEDQADLMLLRANIAAGLFELDVRQSYRHRPQDYVEMIGSGLFFPLTSTDGNEQARLSSVLARMEQVPRVLEEARHNLKRSDPVFLDTALDENAGNTVVIEQIGSMIHTGSPLRSRYDAASRAARAALDSYAAWLKDDLAHRPHPVSWRTGPEVYAKIFAYALGPGTHETPDSVLAAAERDLPRVRDEMYSVALPLHKQWFPGHGDRSDLSGDALENKVIAE